MHITHRKQKITNRFYKRYSNLIKSFLHTDKNGNEYKELDFEQFLKIKYPRLSLFKSNYKNPLKEKHKDLTRQQEENIFKKEGVLRNVSIKEMRFYQKPVGIEGPKNTSIKQPVLIIKHNKELILYNGYHRALHFISKGHKRIKGYVLCI
jgi:hypothetical protein